MQEGAGHLCSGPTPLGDKGRTPQLSASFPRLQKWGPQWHPPVCHRTGVRAHSASAPPTLATQLPKQAWLHFLPLLLPGTDPSGHPFFTSLVAPML